MKSTILLSISILFSLLSNAQTTPRVFTESKELGQVAWYRDYDQALQLAEQKNKSVLILFQEVPGCATCRNYGQNVLSHPLMVEAIEELFIPLAIFNNKKGEDLKILKKYKEPTWNNPVVRIVNAKGADLIPRIASDYAAITLLGQMKRVLSEKGEAIPEYINLLEAELNQHRGSTVQEKDYKMYCFWSGEKALGEIDGVISTKSGFKNGSEVVKVTYDQSILSEADLDKLAQQNSCKPQQKGQFKLAESDLHYYLQHSDYRYIPMTEIQKTKVNSVLGKRENPNRFLSPQQLRWVKALKNNELKKSEGVFTADFQKSWSSLTEKARKS